MNSCTSDTLACIYYHSEKRNILFFDPLLWWSISGLHFALDPLTVPPSLHLSSSFLTITHQGDSPSGPPAEDKVRRSMNSDPVLPEVCADVVIKRGQYYWEVDVCNSSVYRIGENSPEFVLVGLRPACLLFSESHTISQQDCACLRPQSYVNTHAHVIRRKVQSATKCLVRL